METPPAKSRLQLLDLSGRLAPGLDAKLSQDRRDVVVDRLLGKEKLSCYLGITDTCGDEGQYLDFPRRELCLILQCAWPRATR